MVYLSVLCLAVIPSLSSGKASVHCAILSLTKPSTSLQLAEQEREGGLANRVSPMISQYSHLLVASIDQPIASTDVPGLLNRAGFTLTTVDVEDITISYPSIWELMEDLRDMGETNAIMGRKAMINRDVLLAAEAIYKGATQSGL